MVSYFKHEQVACSSKEKILKADCQLFSHLFISCQTRQCDLSEFFKHENQSAPASLSDNGKLHTCQKSQLMDILKANVIMPDIQPQADTIIIDGSAFINALPPRNPKTYGDYAREDVLSKVELYCTKYQRVDLVLTCISLKAETRAKRGTAIRRRVTDSGKVPTNWPSFLRDDQNKTELFQFLADKLSASNVASTVIATKGEDVVSNKEEPLANLARCPHEEADTRIFLHSMHATVNGSRILIVKANDTDVAVIAISVFTSLKDLGLQELWLAFGQGSHAQWIPVHDIVSTIGPRKVTGLPFFHAFTGCDVVSAFWGKAKKSVWQTWSVYDEVSSTFSKLSKYPTVIEENDLKMLEKFVVLMYDRSSGATCVNDARLDLFARKQRSYDAIPPTRAALEEHVKRATYQAGVV